VNMKRIGAEAAVVSALAFTAVGISAGIASAHQPVPSSPGDVEAGQAPLGRLARRLGRRLAWWSGLGRPGLLRERAMRVGAASGFDVGAASCVLSR